jgi:S-formylglutathione hydrolase FrmB
MTKKIVALLLFTVCFLLANSGQTIAQSAAVSVATNELDSKLMARRMPYNVVLPTAYQTDKDARFPVLYLLHGLGGNYKNWTEKTSPATFAKHQFIIVTVEGGNGWYTDSVSKPADKYESYIVQELIPEIDKNFRTISDRKGRAIAGLSMGGFGALKFGVKYSEKFALAASMSGAVSIASWQTTEQIPPMFRQMIVAAFGDEKSETKKSNDLFKLFGELPSEKLASLPFFYLDCGTEDELQLLPFNQQLAGIMLQRKIPHEFRQLPGRHNWNYWNQQIIDVLRLTERTFNSAIAASTAPAK